MCVILLVYAGNPLDSPCFRVDVALRSRGGRHRAYRPAEGVNDASHEYRLYEYGLADRTPARRRRSLEQGDVLRGSVDRKPGLGCWRTRGRIPRPQERIRKRAPPHPDKRNPLSGACRRVAPVAASPPAATGANSTYPTTPALTRQGRRRHALSRRTSPESPQAHADASQRPHAPMRSRRARRRGAPPSRVVSPAE